jgi:hypothetical protein
VRRRAVVVVSRLMLLPLAFAACATSSTVENRSGGAVEAYILGGSPGSVYLRNKESGPFTMRRDDIADVDFPGNLHIAGGVALTAFGAWRLYVGDTSCATLGEAGSCALNVGPAIAGLLALGWGLYAYVRANRRFADRSKPEPDAVMKPRPPAGAPKMPGWRKPDPFADPR